MISIKELDRFCIGHKKEMVAMNKPKNLYGKNRGFHIK